MGIQINGQTDSISATDGSISIQGGDLGSASASNLNITGIVTATTLRATSLVVSGITTVGILSSTGPFTITQQPFFQNVQGISTDFTVQSIYNSMSIGPIGINTGVTVVISTGANWVIV